MFFRESCVPGKKEEEPMHVLVVEDDRALGLFLQKGLQLEGHDVEWVGDGEAALEKAEANPPDLMVLDLSLPRRDGTEVLAEMRRLAPETSVLVLTGRSQIDERVRCLNAGADDCMLKPFSFHELAARCRAILRRRSQTMDPVLHFGEIAMNRIHRSVHRRGVSVELTGKEFALLEFLLLRRGELCDRAELLREVWQMAPESNTNVVDVYINYLRRKLSAAHPEDEGGMPLVETVRGKGYRLLTGRVPARRMPQAVCAVAMEPMARGA
jgi:DNA-binding response OmpR family regulator